MQAPPSSQKVCNENERNKQEKQCAYKIVIDGRKHFIRHTRKTGENDLANFGSTILGTMKVHTICLVNAIVGLLILAI